MGKFKTLDDVFADPFFEELMNVATVYYSALYEMNNGDVLVLLNEEQFFPKFAKIDKYKVTHSGYLSVKLESANLKDAVIEAVSFWGLPEGTLCRVYSGEWDGQK